MSSPSIRLLCNLAFFHKLALAEAVAVLSEVHGTC